MARITSDFLKARGFFEGQGIVLDESGNGKRSPSLVVGLRSGPDSSGPLEYSARLATLMGARLRIVHAIELRDYPSDSDSLDWEERLGATLSQQRADTRSLLENHPVSWEYQICRGDPAAVLIRVADQIDGLMIVIGAPTGSWRRVFHRWQNPSVTRNLFRRSSCPVLVVGPNTQV